MHEAKLAKMEAEMKMVFQQKVQEKEAKLKQSEEELYARHREMKEALEKQRLDLEDKKRRIENGRPLTPEGKTSVSCSFFILSNPLTAHSDWQEEPLRIGSSVIVSLPPLFPLWIPSARPLLTSLTSFEFFLSPQPSRLLWPTRRPSYRTFSLQ